VIVIYNVLAGVGTKWHAYGYTLEWARLRGLAEALPETWERLREQVRAFLASRGEGSGHGT